MPLLRQEPPARIDSLDDLLGIAMALETEAVRRYAQLAEVMDRRGDAATAATFRTLMAEEGAHVTAVDRWAADLGCTLAGGTPFDWLLPPDIAESWDDLLDRTRLTPYQALSLAVVNEQRAFAFYSHIAAATADPAVRRHAEALAQEELNHAALLRRERRRAYHRGATGTQKPERIASPAALDHLARTLFAAAAAGHAALARQLAAAGDAEGAAVLDAIAAAEAAEAGTVPPAPPADGGRTDGGAADPWMAAAAAVETLAERFADIAAAATDEAVLTRALALQESATRHLVRLSGTHSPPRPSTP